jgi:predicted ribosomally synthesized peptide with nif11-like leader
MSAEGATALYKRVTSDEAFRAQLEGAESREEKRRFVTEAGYDVSRDDLSTVRNLAGVSNLSDEDLEKVAGGTAGDTTWILGIGGGGIGVGAVAIAAVALL